MFYIKINRAPASNTLNSARELTQQQATTVSHSQRENEKSPDSSTKHKKMRRHIFFALGSFFLCSFVFNGGFAQTKKMVCPRRSEIQPVKCKDAGTRANLKIDSGIKSQQELSKIMQKIRNASGVTADEFLEVKYLDFNNLGDSVPTLDLGVLGKTEIQVLFIVGKFPRVKLSSSSSGLKSGDLSVKRFDVYDSPGFAPSNLNQTLSIFDMNKLEDFRIYGSSISGFPALLPKLAGLTTLIIANGDMPKIETGQFRGNPKLEWLRISNSSLKEIQKGAFDFGPERNVNSTTLFITDCPIEDSGIHPNNGLVKLGGEVQLHVMDTNITSLGKKNWKGYFSADKRHLLFLYGHPLVCSPKLKWLKIGRKQFEPQLYDPFCSNDEDKTVFNSTLV